MDVFGNYSMLEVKMQDVLTLPVEKRGIQRSVVTPQTYQPTEQPSRHYSGSVIHTNGNSSNGATSHAKNKPKSEQTEDPYPYGWRYIETTTEEGETTT